MTEEAPRMLVEEHRQLDTERCEAMIMYMQPGIRRGEPQTVTAAVGVLRHKARINGYEQPEQVSSGSVAFQININLGDPPGDWPKREAIEVSAEKIRIKEARLPSPKRPKGDPDPL